jgi:uncharacterized protein (DUF736 family)
MATIGTFKKSGAEFLGQIVTLNVQTKNVRIIPEANRTSENAPSHRIFVGRAEVRAAWSKRSAEQRDYLSVKLEDPSFNAPIYANLVQSSRTRKAKASPSSGPAAARPMPTETHRRRPARNRRRGGLNRGCPSTTRSFPPVPNPEPHEYSRLAPTPARASGRLRPSRCPTALHLRGLEVAIRAWRREQHVDPGGEALVAQPRKGFGVGHTTGTHADRAALKGP